MPTYFCLTVRFLQPYAHGRVDGGEPEWPPSPMRMFQALVAAAAARWNERTLLEYAAPALRWLELLPQPTIVAAIGVASKVKCQFFVPDNTADLVVPAWSRGELNKVVKRTEKIVRPTHLQGDAVHYLFALPDGVCPHFDVLQAAARSITHLGWGVDMVAGNAELLTEEQVAKLPGERWVPSQSGTPLRVPKDGTLADLMEKHKAFLGRLSNGGFRPVPPLREFGTVCYRRTTDPGSRPIAAFRITSIDPDDRPPSFNTARKCRDVAARVRHATANVCEGWPHDDPASFVHGHDDAGRQLKGESADRRFMYLPLPSIERRGELGEHVGDIRRVLVTAPPGCEEQIEWIRRRLPGEELTFGDSNFGMLIPLVEKADWVLGRYVGQSNSWSTVTPVVLPGYDDPGHLRRRLRENRDADLQHRLLDQLHQRTDGLLRKALTHAGLSAELVSGAKLEWREVGFRAGTDPASRYVRPERLGRFAAVHVRVRFANAIPGPLAIGAGRYRGLGLFASESR